MEFTVRIRALENGNEREFDFPVSETEVGSALNVSDVEAFEYIVVESSLNNMIREHDSIEVLNEFYDKVESVDDKVVLAYHEVTGYSVSQIVEYDVDFDEIQLLEDVASEWELGEYFVEELGWEGVGKENMKTYFDYQAYGRDINLGNQGGFSIFGYLEIM